MNPDEIVRLLGTLAVHPILPPTEVLPATDETLQSLLADLARGETSTHAAVLRQVSADHAIAPEELARRAQFLLACLILPASGTHYEMLGVSSQATTGEIRTRWAALIQRYHPDRFGGESDWLDEQARRLIAAYEILRDPERRRQYDAELARGSETVPMPSKPRLLARTARVAGPVRRRWVPLGIAAVGLAAVLWASTRPAPEPLPGASVPPSPKLLEAWGKAEAPARTEGRDPVRPAERSQVSRRPASARAIEALTRSAVPSIVPAVPRSSMAPTALTPPAPAPPAPADRSTVSVPFGSATSLAPPVAFSTRGSGTGEEALVTEVPTPPAPVVAVHETPGVASPPVRALPSTEAPPAASAGVSGPSASWTVQPGPPPLSTVTLPTVTKVLAPTAEGAVPPGLEALAVVEAFRQAYERQELHTLMSLLGADPWEQTVRGRPAVEALYARTLGTLHTIRYELSQLEVAGLGAADTVIVHGQYRIRARQGRWLLGRSLDVTGPIRWTLRREDGALRIAGIEYQVRHP